MAKVACPSCGRLVERSETIKGLCPNCYKERYGVARLPRKLEVVVCKYCGAYRYQGSWNQATGRNVGESIVDFVNYILTIKVRPGEGLEEAWVDSVEPLAPIDQPGLHRFRVSVAARKGNIVVRDETVMDIHVKAGICPSCMKRVTGTGHEAEVKIRSTTGRMSESLRRNIEEFLSRTLPSIREAIVKVERVREGIDIYLSDASAARMLAGKLRAEFQGSLNESYKLVSRRPSGKRIGRLTISVRIPDLEPGSVFSLDDRYYILLGRTRRGLLAIETTTGREIVLPGPMLENANPAEYPGGPMMRRYMLLSKEGGTVVFLDADKDFQEVVEYPEERVKVLTDRFEAGATYWVFITRGRAYVLKRSEEDAV